MSSPLEFAAAYTADFVAASMPVNARTLLDIGCGDGLITRQLQQRGYDVVAIDGSIKGIERAKKNNVEAIHCKLEDFSHQPFDCVYMSRALHHMPPLKPTLKKVYELLAADGTLVIEDFGFDFSDEAACAWLFEQSHKAIASQSEPLRCEFHHEWLHENVTSPKEAFKRWQKRYSIEHELWSASQMLAALGAMFDLKIQTRVPYLFRFICDLLPDTSNGAKHAQVCFSEEQRLVDDKRINAVGLRVVATRR